MHQLIRKIAFSSIVAIIAAAVILPAAALAKTPYPNYYISPDNFYLKVPAPYVPDGFISLDDQPEGGLKKAQDIFIDHNNHLYIADTENKRVVKMDNNGKVLKLFGVSENASDPGVLSSPRGVFVDEEGMVFVADTGKERIVQYDEDGKYIKEFGKPDSVLLGADFKYQPTKIVVDSRKYFYVVNQGDQKGLMMLDSEGGFRGYFGGNRVEATFATTLIRLLYNKEQRAGSYVKLPYSFNNVSISPDGYVYASTTGLSSNQIRKLNAVGGDVYPAAGYNFKDRSFNYDSLQQNFTDVTVDADGNMTIIDKSYGRMYQYDVSGRMLYAFGSNGIGKGLFGVVSSLSVDSNGYLYALDELRGGIHKFRPTEFTKLVHKANSFYNEGKYEESFGPWEEVRKRNNFYELALVAMGQTNLRQEEYAQAMDYFKNAYDKAGYSDAFYEFRRLYVKENFDFIATTVVVVLVAIFILFRFRSRMKWRLTDRTKQLAVLRAWLAVWRFIKLAFRVMTKPFLGFEELRYEDKGRWKHAFILIGLYVGANILNIFIVSYLYESIPIQFVDWQQVILFPFLYWVIFSTVNYMLTTIMGGEGRWRDVFIATAYVFTPYIFFSVPLTLLTHILTFKEARFYDLFSLVLVIWMVFLFYVNVRETHSYETGQAIGITLLTGIGSVILVGLYLVLYGLGLNVIDFVEQVAREAFFVGS
ncbi:YIP1 family protein [Paenibacillus spongiae]|uniref:YIP1 family protein n=1 Tax=Paenibacillus spongiae TaxID=2909671 RepID=A0ABY5S127_9BACL|nr:YIP1 family protein [Paenibacillus spongiae]UVI27562.1 YIP1 family protein [Paenibacillus spongiae]